MSGDSRTTDESYVLTDLKHHPRVCSNCFRLRHHEDPIPKRITRLAQRTQWASAVLPPRARTVGMSGSAPLLGNTVSARAPRTVCECGAVSAYTVVSRTADDPLDKATVIEYASHISDTLSELTAEAWERDDLDRAARYHHDRDVLFDAARHLKTTPEHQFKDDLILAAATEVACNRPDKSPNEPRGPLQHGNG